MRKCKLISFACRRPLGVCISVLLILVMYFLRTNSFKEYPSLARGTDRKFTKGTRNNVITKEKKIIPAHRSQQDLIDNSQDKILSLYKILIGANKRAILLDVANLCNPGDQAIVVGEVNLLSKLNVSIVHHVIGPVTGSLPKLLKIATNTCRDCVFLFSGGGTMGFYFVHDRLRIKVAEMFLRHRIVFFPQSLYEYPNINTFQQLLKSFSKHPDLHFVARDQESFTRAQRYFPNNYNYLCPDVAFWVGASPRAIAPIYDIVWIKRRDKEKIKYDIPFRYNGSKVHIHVDDWRRGTGADEIGIDIFHSSTIRMYHGLLFVQRGRVAVTDRLHGLILAILAHVPVVYIDNKLRKVSNYGSTWCRNVTGIQAARSAGHAMDLAMELLHDKDLYGVGEIPTKLRGF